MEVKLTVLFEQTFWIGIFSVDYDGYYKVGKHIFGSEPKDCEIYDLILKEYYNINFSRTFEDTLDHKNSEKKMNPKRLQRMVKKEVKEIGIGTKSQIAINAEREAHKMEKKVFNRKKMEEQKRLEYEKKQEKKKQKKRGH